MDFLCEHYTGETLYQTLLDINMPRLNGWEFIEVLKGIQAIKSDNISIYIVYSSYLASSSTDESDIQKANTLDWLKAI